MVESAPDQDLEDKMTFAESQWTTLVCTIERDRAQHVKSANEIQRAKKKEKSKSEQITSENLQHTSEEITIDMPDIF